jgi:hypothetical protein
MINKVTRVLAGASFLTAAMLGVVASPASAAPDAASATTKVVVSKVPAKGLTAQQTVDCFGRVGVIKDGTLLVVDWNADGSFDECFAIAPNRAIYHAWPRSNGWDPMPHNGRADDTDNAFYMNGHRTVSVLVNGTGFYCSSLIGSWQPWVRCNPPA